MADLLERMVNQQGQGQVLHPGNHEGEGYALERFQKFLPPKFLGGPSPDIAESWLDRMLDIFPALGYPEERQIAFTIFQFEEAARAWWNIIRAKWDREQTPWTWGLNVEIQEALAATQLETYSQAIEKAQRIESTKNQEKAFHDKKRRQPDPSSYIEGQSSRSEPPFKMGRGIGGPRSTGIPSQANFEKGQAGRETQRGTSRGGTTSGPRMAFGFCGAANHMEDNYWKKGKVRKCYRCGSTEHLIAQCPHLPKEGNLPRAEGNTFKPTNATGNRPKVPARTYAM
ncbi:uncharacterized protein LOC113758087 [Coffea eugenioides]|uniref:uncharacterized protein LOC113758087 n=1 Tax=Coffea eugenioides TaxID=49369 RepID=UPI000F611711|nr:uncharacterized protein LOC113758087 [Coffea eugenioides]